MYKPPCKVQPASMDGAHLGGEPAGDAGHALFRAAERGDVDGVRRALGAAIVAEVNTAGEGGATPAWAASSKGHTHCLVALISAGADVNQADAGGRTPAYAASRGGHTDCLAALIGAGADVNKTNGSGESPAYLASRGGYTDCLAALIGAGAEREPGW